MTFSTLPDPGQRGLWASNGLGDAGLGDVVPFDRATYDFGSLDLNLRVSDLEGLVVELLEEVTVVGELVRTAQASGLTMGLATGPLERVAASALMRTVSASSLTLNTPSGILETATIGDFE